MTRHHHRAGIRAAKFLEALRQPLAQLNIQRICLAMPDGDNRNPVFGFQFDHVSASRPPRPRPREATNNDNASIEDG